MGSEERLLEAGTRAVRAVLTDWLRLERFGRGALTFTFAIDGGNPDLVGGLWVQAEDGDLVQICWRRGGVIPCRSAGKKC